MRERIIVEVTQHGGSIGHDHQVTKPGLIAQTVRGVNERYGDVSNKPSV